MVASPKCLLVAARDLRVHASSPTTYVAAAALLVVQGLAFSGIVRVLSDPTRPAPLGAVFSSFFGGTFLFWGALFAVVAALAMEAIASERGTGRWETTFTGRVSIESVVVGKWLAACVTYTAMWVPTLVFVPLLAAYAEGDVSIDYGPIAGGYLGVVMIGAALLSAALPWSAATRRPLFALVAAFGLFSIWLALGEFDDLTWRQHRSSTVLSALDLRLQMGGFARGLIEGRAVVAFIGVMITGLAATVVVASWGRRRHNTRRLVVWVSVVTGSYSVASIVMENDIQWDWTRSRQHTLDPRTKQVLANLVAPVHAVVVRPQDDTFASAVNQVELLLHRMERAQPRLQVTSVDAVSEPRIAEVMAQSLGLSLADAVMGGTVVFYRDQHVIRVDLSQMAEFLPDALGTFSLARLHAEEALTDAVLRLSRDENVVVCMTRDGGEFDESVFSMARSGWQREGATIRDVLAPYDLSPCSVLVVAARQESMAAPDALTVDRFLESGGSLLLLLDSQAKEDDNGLQAIVGARGISWSGLVPLRMATIALSADGLDHPITQSLSGQPSTVWVQALALRIDDGSADVLLAVPAGDVVDSGAGAAVAAASELRGRVVVFGSAQSFSDMALVGHAAGNQRLLDSAIRWLTEERVVVPWFDKTPERIRLRLEARQRRWLFFWTVAVVPLGTLLFGAFVGWWRRRE